MHLDSLSFVYLFLPLTIAVCLISPMRWRPAVLLAFSALFYWWLEGENLLLLAGIVLFDYLMGRLLERASKMPRLRRGIMICSAVKSVAIFLLYGALGRSGRAFPARLGVVALTSCGYVIDCYFGYTYASATCRARADEPLLPPALRRAARLPQQAHAPGEGDAHDAGAGGGGRQALPRRPRQKGDHRGRGLRALRARCAGCPPSI